MHASRSSRASRLRVAGTIAIIGLMWVFSGLPFAGAADTPTYTGCLAKGKIVKIAQGNTPLTPCSPSKETMIHLSGGDITSITAGTGLTGGGTSADITLSILDSFRLPQGCASGDIASFNGTGWSCAADSAGAGDITGVAADTGLAGGGTEGDVGLNVAPGFRLPQSCASGEVAKSDGSDTWSCASDADTNSGGTVTDVTAGDGIEGGGTTSVSLGLALGYRLPQSCASGEVAKSDGSDTWTCASDTDTNSGGTVTDVTAGDGIEGGGTTSVSLGLALGYRLPQSCSSGEVAKSDGSDGWSCQPDTDTDTNSGGTVTDVTAGDGLSGGGTTSVTLSLATSFQLPQSCSAGDFVTWTGPGWGCALAGDITGVAAGTGLTGTATSGDATLDIKPSYRLPQSCTGAQIAEWNGSSWICGTDDAGVGRDGFTIRSVDSPGSVGYSSITLGSDGFPVVSYSRNGALGIYHCGNVTCSTGTPTTADTGSFNSTSITVGKDGFPIVSYHDTVNTDLKVYHCDDVACTTGSAFAPDTGAGVGNDTSITIGQEGWPVVSYFDGGNNRLKVFHCTNVACTTGSAAIVDAPISGQRTSITVGEDGFPVVSYLDAGAGHLRFFHCTNFDCTGGAAGTTLDTAASTGYFSSVTVGQDGFPVVGYWDAGNNDLKVYKCFNVACTAGVGYSVDTGGNVGQTPSITIGSDDFPIVSYWDVTNNDLKVWHCTSDYCNVGAATAVDTVGNVGSDTSITIGQDGLPVMSYNGDAGNLKIAHCSNIRCIPFHRTR